MEHPRINAYAHRETLSRIGQFRLKRAKARLAQAIADAEDRYSHEVACILGTDRAAVEALRRGEKGNNRPWSWLFREHARDRYCEQPAAALEKPFHNALTVDKLGFPTEHSIFTPAKLLARFGFRLNPKVGRRHA